MQYRDLPQLTHDLVYLRPLTRADAIAWYGYLCMPHVIEHTSWDLRSIDGLAPKFDAIESLSPSSEIRFAIALRSSDDLVGTVGFHTISTVNKTAELAYDLSPAIWGQGIAPAVCESVIAWGFKQLGAVRIQATVLESNDRSIRVLEKSGFEREGLLRSFRMVRGRPGNFWMYARLRLPAERVDQ
ncbi:acetyltransferase family protein [Collimonas arenae]|uniref:Acetyltransferase family protein n=1 Tax=Collimonas arenae TaxID=279058 RepID=A0A127QH25_9BURK|nr:GNAT family protein [Collimonas arenae]AMO99384.1 acetyltransferase family protein [Collimonas arenae]AMP09286.1 acetyltransferase family protein [Collimonas arenae]